jgi:uncharacterized protein YjbJ (UPF0337 family)
MPGSTGRIADLHEGTKPNQSNKARGGTLPIDGRFHGTQLQRRRTQLGKDRIEGSAKQAKGALKETVGKMTGDTKLKTEGAADKLEGKVQNAIGGIKDAARDTTNE